MRTNSDQFHVAYQSLDRDARPVAARQFRDLIVSHTAELGHAPSQTERTIIRQASALEVQIKQLEVDWMRHAPTTIDLEAYSRLTNTLRRHLRSIGLGDASNMSKSSRLLSVL